MNLILAILFFIVLLILIEIVKRIFVLPSEYSRKIAHIFSAVTVFFLPYFLNKWEMVVLALLFVLVLGLSKKFDILKSIHAVDRKTWGEIFLPTGIIIAVLFFLPYNLAAFQFGILVMGLADGFGGIIGSKYGQHKITWLKNNKTWEGSTVFFLVTCLILVFYFSFTYYIILIGLIVAILLTVIEALLTRGFDNLLLPLAAGYLFMAILF